MVAGYPAQSARLKELQNRMLVANNDARRQINRLGSLVWLANLRRNGFFFLAYLIFEFLFFWDVHILDLLEKWKANTGAKARGWFEDLGQWEALCALAKLRADQPQWMFPKVQHSSAKTDAMVHCEQLSHPLIDDRRVANDVQVGPPGTVLLVSGSNMSGKSTLLRSIGVNVVLAQMGSVVCAKKMTLPPLHIETSMRIMDSLADGVSFFMAELRRLKEIVDITRSFSNRTDKSMLFLLDEILQGTNSRERQIAVSRVVRKMIDEHAIGAISTHDLDLATTVELHKACRSVHFSEQFTESNGKRRMTFDYKMLQGIAETTNALKLLEMVGLGEED
jgi:DNA mismatch repair ATPase MutS